MVSNEGFRLFRKNMCFAEPLQMRANAPFLEATCPARVVASFLPHCRLVQGPLRRRRQLNRSTRLLPSLRS